MGERYDNIASRDGSYGWEDVVHEREMGEQRFELLFSVLVDVATGRKDQQAVVAWLEQHYPERYREALNPKKAADAG
jgi:hypothetical protein